MFHLQSLNIHKQDPLLLTYVMSYVFQMISVERVIEYTELEEEAAWEYVYRPPPSWPREGRITFDEVNLTYSLDGPLVLNDLGAYAYRGVKVCFSHLSL